MLLVKRVVFGIFIILAAGLGVWAYLQLKNNKKPKVDALSLLPDNCLVYLRTVDFFELSKKLNSQSLIADKLKFFNPIGSFFNTLNHFDSLFKDQPLLRNELSGTVINFALYPDNMNWLLTFNVQQLGEQEAVEQKILQKLQGQPLEDQLNAFKLNKQTTLYFTVNSGVVLISSAQQKIKEALNGSSKKFISDPSYLEFKSTLEENSLLSVFINHSLYEKSVAAAKLNLPFICRNGFSAGMMDIQPSELKINGYLKPDPASLLSVFKGQPAQSTGFVSALPFATHYFQAFGFDNFSDLKINDEKNGSAHSDGYWKTVNDSALYNVEKGFYANVSGYVLDFESGSADQKFVAVKITDSILAKEHLILMSDSVIVQNTDSVFRIRKMTNGNAFSLLQPLSGCITWYAALYHAHIYFSEKAENLQQLLYQFKNNMIMTENESFMSYKNQNFPEKFTYLVYSSPALYKKDRASFFNFKSDSKRDPFENFKHFSFSVANNNGEMEFRWHLLHETDALNKEQNILWALQLDTTASMKAQSFVNHITKENELLVQDDQNRLYLVNAKGTVLWKRQLTEKIISKLFTVDIFKNNKYQLLFSSRNQLHLMDRNGNYLPGYPVKLPAEASSALAVFDYDQTRDYRLFIACKNKQIYNYAITGEKQNKFTNVKTDNLVRLPVQYVKVGPSDYLVALDEDGKIYTFSRRGEGRIGLKNKATANCSAFFVDATANINSTYFIYADDKNSMINKISLADQKDIIKLNYGVENAGINFYEDRDRKKVTIVFTKLNAVIVYDINGNLLSHKTFENDLNETDLYNDENGSLYLTRSDIRGELLVLDPLRDQTKLYMASALPLVSDLFNDHKKYLVITNGNRLSCVLLN